MRVVFMGTPALAATVLKGLEGSCEVVGVFTRPDAVRGRGRKLVGSPVKNAAFEAGLDVFTFRSLKDGEAVRTLRALRPDVICIAAYGAILPLEALSVPRLGCLNVHTSLLPRWRGAAPIERAILAGDEQSGVCIMKMEEGLDTGPYCLQERISISGLYVRELSCKLAQIGADLLVQALDLVDSGKAIWVLQNPEGVTYASKIEKGELDARPDDLASNICLKVRASSPAHPSKTLIAGKSLTLERVDEVDLETEPPAVQELEPGQATFFAKRLFLGARRGVVEVSQVKPDGKKSMDAKSFAAGIQGIKNKQVAWGRI